MKNDHVLGRTWHKSLKETKWLTPRASEWVICWANMLKVTTLYVMSTRAWLRKPQHRLPFCPMEMHWVRSFDTFQMTLIILLSPFAVESLFVSKVSMGLSFGTKTIVTGGRARICQCLWCLGHPTPLSNKLSSSRRVSDSYPYCRYHDRSRWSRWRICTTWHEATWVTNRL
jgi:hypothetical protein